MRGLHVHPVAFVALVAVSAAGPTGAAEPALEEQLEAFLRARARVPVEAVEVPELGLRPGERGLEARFSVHPAQELTGWVPVRISLLRNGHRVRSLVANAHVTTRSRLVVARRRIPPGGRISLEDVEVVEWPSSRVPRGALRDPRAVEGQRARRAIAAGAALLATRLEPVPDVERGQRIKIRLVQGALVIETHGTAQQDGVVGDWIQARSAASPRSLEGRLGEGGVLHVEL